MVQAWYTTINRQGGSYQLSVECTRCDERLS